MKNIIDDYVKILNYGAIKCPNCHSHDLIKWGYYERNVIFFSNDGNILENKILKIQRVICKGCNKTHALLPFGIIPHKQFTDEVISKMLLELTYNSLENISDNYHIDQSILKKWYTQYNKYHKAKVNTFNKCHTHNESLRQFLNNFNNKYSYVDKYNNCFMQIKLGCLGLCPS